MAVTYLREIEHRYGGNIHILDDPYMHTLLAELSMAKTVQPRLNWLLSSLYDGLLRAVINNEFPRKVGSVQTRMGAEYRGELLDRSAMVVSVDIARAGIKPSMICYELLSTVLDPAAVRQDHIVMERTMDEAGTVTGRPYRGPRSGGRLKAGSYCFRTPWGPPVHPCARSCGTMRKGPRGAPPR